MRDQARVLLAVSGLNQQEAAHRVGISAGTLSRFMRGERLLARRTERRLVEVLTEEILAGVGRAEPQVGRSSSPDGVDVRAPPPTAGDGSPTSPHIT